MASSAFASADLVKGGGRLILELDIGERLPVVVPHDEAGVVVFLDSPDRREAVLTLSEKALCCPSREM